MSFFFFLKKFNMDWKFFSNSFFSFVFFFNNEKSLFFLFCFRLSKQLVVFNSSTMFCLAFPFFSWRNYNVVKNSFFTSFLNVNFLIKRRLRFSGLGYFADSLVTSLRIHVGLTVAPVFLLPSVVFDFKLNKRKKKVLLKGFILSLLNNFCSKLRSVKTCDVYKHKGIRLRFERIRTKEGKRSGNR